MFESNKTENIDPVFSAHNHRAVQVLMLRSATCLSRDVIPDLHLLYRIVSSNLKYFEPVLPQTKQKTNFFALWPRSLNLTVHCVTT